MHGLGHMTASEMLETMHGDDLFDIFSELSGEGGAYPCCDPGVSWLTER